MDINRIRALDGLRGIAALSVVITHVLWSFPGFDTALDGCPGTEETRPFRVVPTVSSQVAAASRERRQGLVRAAKVSLVNPRQRSSQSRVGHERLLVPTTVDVSDRYGCGRPVDRRTCTH